MKLLVATDNTFYRTPEGVYDAFCFDRAFFDDYRSVFDEVLVAARMSRDDPPGHAHRSDGDGVRFVDLENVHGGKWALAPMRWYCGRLLEAVTEADAVCVRIPSVSGIFAARLARKQGKPLMFEQVGDPLLIGAFGLAGKLFARHLAFHTRRIVRDATVGSYVSQRHLQRRYPPGQGTLTDGISSIRLPDEEIRPARRFPTAPNPLRLILVASLLRYKDHGTLIRALERLGRERIPAVLDLVGDGPMRGEIESTIQAKSLSGRVRLLGHVAGRERVNHLLDASDIFVLPSIGEGMPRAMIEAMSRGLPTLGARTEATEELLPMDQLFPVGDDRSLAVRLVGAVRTPALLDRWARNSERTARRFAGAELSGRRRLLLTALRSAAEHPGACDG